MLRFLFKICQKYVIFKDFQVHFQVFLLFKSNGYKKFYITFEGPNVNKIISYFEHLYKILDFDNVGIFLTYFQLKILLKNFGVKKTNNGYDYFWLLLA